MAICPAGHTSAAEDYCDICGLPVTAGPDAGAPSAPPPAATPGAVCPNCGTTNAPDALFCEACGYDFTTGTMPRSVAPAPAVPPAQWSSVSTPGDPGSEPDHGRSSVPTPDDSGSQNDQPDHGWSSVSRPPSPTDAPDQSSPIPAAASDPDASSSPAPDPGSSGSPTSPSPADAPVPSWSTLSIPEASVAAPEPSAAETSSSPSAAPVESPTPAATPPVPTPPSRRPLQVRPTSVEWVAEVWIDPDWYATQGSTDALPSPGLPDVVPLRSSSALIGRTSRSRNIHPDIDCELDSGVSRRHAQVTTDGSRWWIEDLESANGTYIGPSAGPLPADPIGRGRVEFAPDQRIYLGAWTRIVIRTATDDEKQAFNN
ncbi:MAG: FHA domain-containing protein [Micropruina sp.]|uniref:FHA domain-containing protein n=1 Tax=Micropruina sp. TaxID=2737536 RepID=UPI0039E517C8